jgi:hypothetical protein
MKKNILLFLLLPLSLWSQNINKIEYFIDTDPGVGNGINVPITAATNIANFNISVDLSTVSVGFHKVYTRSRDAMGHWSETAFYTFYKAATYTPPTLPKIVEIEYFVNTDPGVGNATKRMVVASTVYNSFPLETCLLNAVVGANKLYVRSKDASGKWSETATIGFTFSGVAPTDCNTVLPIELTSFTGKMTEGGSLLTWQTISELGINNFELEKSLNGKNFLKIGELKANNTPSIYQVFDDTPLGAGGYYRLKINELNGAFSYSKIIYLEKNSDTSIKISQSTEGSIFVETNDKIELITITNTIGQLIKYTKDKRFLINELNAGIYIVSVKTDKGYLSRKIFKE